MAIGRERSKALIADTKPNRSIISLVTQHNPDTDYPGFDDIYTVGTAASILKIIKMPQGSMHIVVHGLTRFEITGRVSAKPYLKARVKLVDVKAKMTKKLKKAQKKLSRLGRS